MSMEIEAKFRVDSHDPVRNRLREVGATFVAHMVETNRIFDARDGLLRARGEGLRIRVAVSEDGRASTTLTFKGPRLPGALKQREELEVSVSDGQTAADILDRLGYVQVLCYQKRRERWRLGACLVELDEPAKIGLFVEIEGPDAGEIEDVQGRIGLGDHKHVSSSYVRMVMHHCQEQGLVNRTLEL